MESLLGEEVMVWCECYIYSGRLIGVNSNDILLENAHVVYETGDLNQAGYTDAQPFKHNHYIRISKIESYGKAV